MAKNAAGAKKKAKPQKPFRIELGWKGMFGVLLVSFFLFLWMFLLGIWAGQSILLPPANMNEQAHVSGTPTPDPLKHLLSGE